MLVANSGANRFWAIFVLVTGFAVLVFSSLAATTGGDGASAMADAFLGDAVRRFSFEYVVEIPARIEADAPIKVFLPIATDATGQRILDVSIESEFAGGFDRESVHGNRYWSAELPAERSKNTSIVVRYDVERSIVRSGDDPGSERRAKRFLAANERVVVDHPVLAPILEEIRAHSKGADRAGRARAIYDWIVDHVEYKKVGTGWGNGDTFWACTERYGNCTDFHSLFISLARTEGIPARFQMGFLVPADRGAGMIEGYHCWVEFWLPEIGWVPIDVSEASRHPARRELFYGTHPADRVKFTTGRDLRLGLGHEGRPLNYFIYPYLEIRGEASHADIRTSFRYRELARS
ncbi:MAG: transglutaminase domain-containing protein [bacterium]|nr:transglutaminase [Deltaproteobacteria bacterium]MCP4905296.1 transglutaminase domain-containing protein [bacterium]